MPKQKSASKLSCKDWDFVKELSLPEIPWFCTSQPGNGKSVYVKHGFRDPEDVLHTAFESLNILLAGSGYTLKRSNKADYVLATARIETSCFEEYTIETSEQGAVISAGDCEGIRRGIYAFIDLIHIAGGHFPQPGQKIHRKPFLKLRLARCPYGLVKRWPLNQDELLCNDIEFYPYFLLERFAHDGINAVWIVTQLRELGLCDYCAPDPQRMKRIRKLRKIVDAAADFGIKVFLFMIEPFALAPDDPMLELCPSVKGPMAYNGRYTLCPNSPDTQKYLTELITSVFSEIPGLGGILDINIGERPTSCISTLPLAKPGKIACQDKCGLQVGEILNKLLTTMNNAMHAVDPATKLVSWFYMPHANTHQPWVETLSDFVPDDVIAQFNFESGGEKTQLGKKLRGVDYWVSYDGPAQPFVQAAKHRAGKEFSAKIQLGCGYDLATVPFIPAPAIAYRKYKGMQKLGVNNVMQAWYPGNFPGIMTNAMGLLAFEDFTEENQDQFVRRLASINWGSDAETVSLAWKEFDKAYQNFPFTVPFQYYSPMNSMPKWKFHILPDLDPLAPPWKPTFAIGGDAIGEAMGAFSIMECIELIGKMNRAWHKGLDLLLPLRPKYAAFEPRIQDILVAHTIGGLMLGTYNLLMFYALRRKLFQENDKDALAKMKDIITLQRTLYEQLKDMLPLDSRIGFHGEALYYVFTADDMEQADKDAENALKLADELEKSPLAPRDYTIQKGIMNFIEPGQKRSLTSDDELTATWNIQLTEKTFKINLEINTTSQCIIFQPYFIDLTGTDCEFTEIYRLYPKGNTPIVFVQNGNDYTTGHHHPAAATFAQNGNTYSFEYPIDALPTGMPSGEFVRFNAALSLPETDKTLLLNGEPYPGRLYKSPVSPHDTLCVQLKK